MSNYSTLNHTTWDCKYHVVFIPKYRRKSLYGQIRSELRTVFHRLAFQKECSIIEGELVIDHVHMLLSIPSKYSVAQIVGFLKGKSAIHIARHFGNVRRNVYGQNFWARGYFVSTVGFNEQAVRQYIQNQEAEGQRITQGNLFK
ncbi:MAG TPA: IS200/IS605 family transposase [Candidatus Megaira endosymbiont of Nemacystus decipiens]|nr:IS200/IS605 family transposase [Candidatus Megaera endosymbiont of Nemacystus decipiens]